MKKLSLLIVFFYAVTTASSFAQTLVIGKSSTLFPNSCDSGSMINLQFNVIYQGATISGAETIKINYQLNGKTYTLPNSTPANSLSNGDSVTVTDTLAVDSSTGFISVNTEDIVVIWPTGSGGIAVVGDSITDSTYVNSTTGIAPIITPSFNIALYPNPAGDVLYLNYNENIIHLEQVRIYDLLGRTIRTETSSFNSIAITTLPNGVYFLKAITTDESQYITQFVKIR